MPLTSRPSNYNLRSLNNPIGEEAAPVDPPAPVEEEVNVQGVVDPVIHGEVSQKIMAAHVFKLETFSGNGKQKVQTYLKRFDQYKACVGLDDAQALAALAWHLDGNARLWFDQLDPVPDTLDKLKDALTNKYKLNDVVNMNVYSMKQNLGESVGEFLQRLEGETYKTKISNELQVQIALNGMERTIASAISTHAPKTLDDVKQLTFRMSSIKSNGHAAESPTVAGAAAITSKLETTVEVLTAAVAKLATTVEETKKMTKTDESCGRCGGRCFSLANCKAMGKTCYKCNKLNHFGNKCRTGKMENSPRPRPQQQYGQPQRHYNQPPRPRFPNSQQ